VTAMNMSQMIHLIARESPADSKELSLLNADSPREQTFPGAARDLDAPSMAAPLPAPRTTVMLSVSLNVKSEREVQGVGGWLSLLSVAGRRLFLATHRTGCALVLVFSLSAVSGVSPVSSRGGSKTYNYSRYWPTIGVTLTRWK
jgi:hypothetical protein